MAGRPSPRFERELRRDLAAASPSCFKTPVISEHFPQSEPTTDVLTIEGIPIVLESARVDHLEDPRCDGESDLHELARKCRTMLLQRLEDEGEDKLHARLSKCGEPIDLVCTSCGGFHRAERRCSLKWCPVCQRALAAKRSLKYERAAAAMIWPMHVTLTRANLGEISRADIRALLLAFKKFRRQDFWKKTVRGGLASLELTNTGKGWHPHLHILCDCEWLAIETPKPKLYHSRAHKRALCKRAAQELERNWSACIGQLLSSVRVRRCDGKTAVREVLKYSVKGSDLVDSRDAIGPAIRAISECRLSTPFGSLYRLKLSAPKQPAKCKACGERGTMALEVVELGSRKSRSRAQRKAERDQLTRRCREITRRNRAAAFAR